MIIELKIISSSCKIANEIILRFKLNCVGSGNKRDGKEAKLRFFQSTSINIKIWTTSNLIDKKQ